VHGLISYGQNHKMMSHFGISATGTLKDIGVTPPLHREFPKPETRNEKAPGSHFGISATGSSRDKRPLLLCIGNRRNPKREMQKRPRSHFGIPATGSSRDKGAALLLHRESPKREMRKVFSLGHPPWKKQLMNIEQVVEISAQAMNAGHGGSGRQSAQDRPVCRFS
jgi:hypothetical protein